MSENTLKLGKVYPKIMVNILKSENTMKIRQDILDKWYFADFFPVTYLEEECLPSQEPDLGPCRTFLGSSFLIKVLQNV